MATKAKKKRKVSAATLARLKELRRANGLGEFKNKSSAAPRKRLAGAASPRSSFGL